MYIEGTNGFYEYRLYGDLILTVDDSYIAYAVEAGKPRLFLDGTIYLPEGEGEGEKENTCRYMMMDDTLYLVKDSEYMSGKITPYGEDAFLYEVDNAESGSTDPDAGALRMMFIRTSALE